MKTIRSLFLLLLMTISFSVFAQDYSGLKDIPLKEAADYKAAEPVVKECVDFVLTHSVYYANVQGLSAVQFIYRWMEGTPDYMFSIDGSLSKVWEQDKYIMGVYMCCMVKYCLENPDKSKDNKEVKLNSTIMFLDYAEHPDSGVKMTSALKKVLKIRKEGKLNEFLKI
jgi:hypothetical protein